MNSNRIMMLTGVVLLVAAIAGLSWPQALPRTDLTLAASPSNLGNNLVEGLPGGSIPQVNMESLDKGSDLAFVWQDLLYVAEAASGSVRALTDSGRAIAPAWSHDGEWLAYIRITDPETNRGPLWLVRSDGSAAHEVQGLPGTLWDWSFVWSPAANQLAVAVHGYGLWLVPTAGKPEQLDPAPWLYRAAWSPDGRYIAYNFCLSGDAPRDDGDHDILCAIDVQQRQRFDLVQTEDAGVRTVGWWPDGQGILYWEVPAHGGSVATDGVMIQSVPLTYSQINGQTIVTAADANPPGTALQRADARSTQPIELVATLPKLHWTQFTPEGKLLAVMGSGRIAWAEKQLVLVNPQTGALEQLAPPAGHTALDPDIHAGDGRIAFVAAPDRGFSSPGPSDKEYADWLAQRTLWLRAKEGNLKELTQAGGGVYGPTWSTDGEHIRYFSDNALWTVAADDQSPAQRVVELGPCEGNGIYGAIDYNTYFAWYEH